MLSPPEVEAVLSDLVKILTSAAITGLVVYLVMRDQINVKLREKNRNYEIDSRDHLFDFYRERSRRLLKKHDKLNESLGRLMGFVIGYSSVAEKEAAEFLNRISVTIQSFSKVALIDSRITKKEMEKNGLNNIREFGELESYENEVKKIELSDDLTALQKNVVTLIEIYSHLHYCQQLMLEKQVMKYSKTK